MALYLVDSNFFIQAHRDTYPLDVVRGFWNKVKELADAFLIAYALADKPNRVIVTQERSQPEIKRKIKIPEPCDELGIRYINTIEMFRQLSETF